MDEDKLLDLLKELRKMCKYNQIDKNEAVNLIYRTAEYDKLFYTASVLTGLDDNKYATAIDFINKEFKPKKSIVKQLTKIIEIIS